MKTHSLIASQQLIEVCLEDNIVSPHQLLKESILPNCIVTHPNSCSGRLVAWVRGEGGHVRQPQSVVYRSRHPEGGGALYPQEQRQEGAHGKAGTNVYTTYKSVNLTGVDALLLHRNVDMRTMRIAQRKNISTSLDAIFTTNSSVSWYT